MEGSGPIQASLPVIVLVTGAWHVPKHYSKLSSRLRHLGYVVECPQLETNQDWGNRPMDRSTDDDIKLIRKLTLELLDQGHNVIAVMHSYGGLVGTHAFSGLGRSSREGKAHVQALVLMSALLTFNKESLATWLSANTIPWVSVDDIGRLRVEDPGSVFFNDLSDEDREEAVAELVDWPSAALASEIYSPEGEAWRSIPSTYVVFTKDTTLPEPAQEFMVSRLENEYIGLSIERRKCDGGHAAFWTRADEMTGIVHEICNRYNA